MPQRQRFLLPPLLFLLQGALVVRAFIPAAPVAQASARVRTSTSSPPLIRLSMHPCIHPLKPTPHTQVAPLRMSLRQDPVAELSGYLQENAGVETVPGDIAALLQLLHYRGEEPVSPAAGKDLDLHPLAIPLTKAADGDYTCLLRWPTPQEGAPIPVVKARGGLTGLKLVAQSTLELAHRLAAEEDHTQGKEADWVRGRGGRRCDDGFVDWWGCSTYVII